MHENEITHAYLIKKDEQYLQVTRTDSGPDETGKRAEVRWTRNQRLASLWIASGPDRGISHLTA